MPLRSEPRQRWRQAQESWTKWTEWTCWTLHAAVCCLLVLACHFFLVPAGAPFVYLVVRAPTPPQHRRCNTAGRSIPPDADLAAPIAAGLAGAGSLGNPDAALPGWHG